MKTPKAQIKFAYIVTRGENRIVSRYVGKGVRGKNYMMGAWTIEYPKSSYKLRTSVKEHEVGYKFRKPRRTKK